MQTRITRGERETNPSDILDRIRDRAEQFIIERDGQAEAVLSPAPPVTAVILDELIARVGNLSLPGDGFADDLEAIRSSQPRATMPQWPD